jgi:dynein heavy chain, axonemal
MFPPSGWDVTDFELLEQSKDKIKPYRQLWDMVAEHVKQYHLWTKGPLFQIDPELAEADCGKMWRAAYKLSQLFEYQIKAEPPKQVALKVKAELDDFKSRLPLVTALCNKGLKERHWEAISDVLGFEMEPNPSFTLHRVLDMGVEKYITELEDLSESAGEGEEEGEED